MLPKGAARKGTASMLLVLVTLDTELTLFARLKCPSWSESSVVPQGWSKAGAGGGTGEADADESVEGVTLMMEEAADARGDDLLRLLKPEAVA